MSWPEPVPGLVIRYAYLWGREAEAGRDEASKDRPAAIILAVADSSGRQRVYALPITHSPPDKPEDAVEIPASTKRRLGLDSERSWIMLTEANVFLWPGPDLRPVMVGYEVSGAFGMLPPALHRQVAQRFVARARARRSRLVARSE